MPSRGDLPLGRKHSIYEGGFRPLIVRHGPASFNRIRATAMSLPDRRIGDFFAKGCGTAPANAGEDSFSFLATLKGGESVRTPRGSVVYESAQGLYAVRKRSLEAHRETSRYGCRSGRKAGGNRAGSKTRTNCSIWSTTRSERRTSGIRIPGSLRLLTNCCTRQKPTVTWPSVKRFSAIERLLSHHAGRQSPMWSGPARSVQQPPGQGCGTAACAEPDAQGNCRRCNMRGLALEVHPRSRDGRIEVNRELATLAGVRAETLCRIETGNTRPACQRWISSIGR